MTRVRLRVWHTAAMFVCACVSVFVCVFYLFKGTPDRCVCVCVCVCVHILCACVSAGELLSGLLTLLFRLRTPLDS